MGLVSFFIFFIVLFINLINEEIEATTKDPQVETSKCSGDETIKCRDDGPPIKFPFWLKGHSNDNCGYPGFQLSCNNQNETMLQLPYSTGNFLVNKINYVYQAVLLSDPHDCIISRLLELNLSSSPFSRYEAIPSLLSKYTLFNCSSTNADPRMMVGDSKEINCLSVHGYQVYAVNTDEDLDNLPLAYCTTGETFTFSNDRQTLKELDGAQVSDTLLTQLKFNWQSDLLLRWNSPSCSFCEENGQGCRLQNNNNNNSTGLPLDGTECFNLPKPPPNHAKGIVIKVVAAGLPVCIFLVIAMIIARRRYRARYFDRLERVNEAEIEKFLEEYKSLKPTRYSYADIKRITNHFQKKLGEGGYGSVFKGIISNEIPVAVKILNNAKGNGEEFINEVGTIGMIHHVNVVRLLGFCADGFKRALVYEFLPNESLEKYIFLCDSKTPFLGWTKLHDIAVGIAKGIEYLHQGCDQRILHFDIKPHNILLDYNFNPKISDFGLAKLCSKENSAVSMTAARGTIGYIAPEVVSRNFGNVSHKSDVYSFGMMLLEMVGGRKNADARAEKSSQAFFPEWIYNRIIQEEDLEIKVETEEDEKIARKLTIVGLWCIQWYPINRPSMKTVVEMLEREKERLAIPPSPFASTATEEKTTGNINDKPAHQVLSVITEQDEVE